MYAPKIQEDQLHQLWKLAKVRRHPMTKVLKAILDEYFEKHRQELCVTVKTVTSIEIKESK